MFVHVQGTYDIANEKKIIVYKSGIKVFVKFGREMRKVWQVQTLKRPN